MKQSFQAVHPGLRKPTRQRQSRSCQPCRKNKSKCNTEKPCYACVRRQSPLDCTYDTDTTTQFEEWPGLINCLKGLGEHAIQRRISSASDQQVVSTPRNMADLEYQLQLADLSTSKSIIRPTLAVFFELGDPLTSMLHAETLFGEWEYFTSYPEAWSQADALSLMALVYGCLALTALYLELRGEHLPGHLGSTSHMLEVFVDRCYQCFHHIDLETRGKYKVEAAIMRIATLVYCKPDLKRSFAALAQAIGLAQSSGYANPRNPSLADLGLSEVQIELGKRAWENLQSLQYHVSFYCNQIQMVLPESKTEALTNLLDVDMPLDHRANLPPPRPLTQFTPVLPLILKRELQRVSTEIGHAIFCKEDISLKEIDEFDVLLDSAHRQVSTPTLAGTVLQVLTLQHSLSIIYHTAKIVLHRWSLLAENTNDQSPPAEKSRALCVSSAVEVLKIQRALLENRRSQQDRWELDPLMMYDFLLATTIVCLELSRSIRSMRPTKPKGDTPIAPQPELCYWLGCSIEFWQEAGSHGVPPEVQCLCDTFCSVLQRFYPALRPDGQIPPPSSVHALSTAQADAKRRSPVQPNLQSQTPLQPQPQPQPRIQPSQSLIPVQSLVSGPIPRQQQSHALPHQLLQQPQKSFADRSLFHDPYRRH